SIACGDFKRVTLELGGSDPMIVCDDADVQKAITGAMVGRFWNAGQACLAVKRLFVFDKVFDEFVQGLVAKVSRYEVGDGMTKAEKPKIRMGPLHTAAQRDEIESQVKDAIDRGAKVLLGGARPEGGQYEKGHYYQPTILVDVPDDARALREETFGPVLPIFRVNSLDEAIKRANDSIYGLARRYGLRTWTISKRRSTGLRQGMFGSIHCITAMMSYLLEGLKQAALVASMARKRSITTWSRKE